MTRLVKKTVMVNRINPETGAAFNPKRLESKEVETFDLEYGRYRAERQQKERDERNAEWRALTPQQQVQELDRRLGVGLGAAKQRKRIAERLAKMGNKEDRPQHKNQQQQHQHPQGQKPKQKAKFRNRPRHHKHNHPKV